jgi:hypothetical protein
MASQPPELITVKEEFSVYKLANGTVLKIRPTLLEATIDPADPSNVGQGKITMTLLTEPVDEDKGEPSADTTVHEETDIIGEVPFTIVNDGLNIYELKGQAVLAVRHRLTKIWKTSKIGKDGTRLFRLESGVAVSTLSLQE